jgi:hypothetical protein
MRTIFLILIAAASAFAQSKVTVNPFPPGSGLQLTPTSVGATGPTGAQGPGVTGCAAGWGVFANGTTTVACNPDITDAATYWNGGASQASALNVNVNNTAWGTESNPGQGIFLMASFIGYGATSDNQLYLLASSGGITFSFLNAGNPVYSPSHPSATRDPRIFQYCQTATTCKIYIAITDTDVGTANSTFTIIESSDLKNWTVTKAVSMAAIGGVQVVWSPTPFFDTDGTFHIFVSAGTTAANCNAGCGIYEVHPTTSDLSSTWSSPVLVTGTSLTATPTMNGIRKDGSIYTIAVTPNSGGSLITFWSSTSLTSGYTVTQSGNWAGWGSGVEGIQWVQTGGTACRIYMDTSGFSSPGGLKYSDNATGCTASSGWSAMAAVGNPFPLTAGNQLSNAGVLRVRDINLWRLVDGLNAVSSPVVGGTLIAPSGIPFAPSVMQASSVYGYWPDTLNMIGAQNYASSQSIILHSNIYRKSSIAWGNINTGSPGWEFYLGYGPDSAGICRAPATAGSSAFVCGMSIDNTNTISAPVGLKLSATSSTLTLKTGSNARVGTGTLVGGALAVANTSVTANSYVFVQDTGGGVGANIGALQVTQSAGVGFTVTSTNALDTSNFRYFIIETN